MNHRDLINWVALSELLSGEKRVIRSNRKNKKYSKEIESLENHLKIWAKENKIEIK
jgi:hypothetical protein